MLDRMLQQVGYILGQHITARNQVEGRRRNLSHVLITIPVPLFD